MRHLLRWGTIALTLAAPPPIAALAQTAGSAPKLVSTHKDWTVMVKNAGYKPQ